MEQVNTQQVIGLQEKVSSGDASTVPFNDTSPHGTEEKTMIPSQEITISTTQPVCSPSSSLTSTETTVQTTE